MVYTSSDETASPILAAGSPFRRQVKIVATLGPAVSEPDDLAAIIDTGVDVARVNCAHGTVEGRARQIELVREIAESRRRNIPILLDLQGLKIRTGPLAGPEPAMLARGSKVRVYPEPVVSTREQLGVTYPGLLDAVRPESRILLADGLIELVVEEIEDDHVVCGVGRGGPLAARQGVTLPNVRLQNASLTDQDRIDVQFAADKRVEFLGLSFISSAADIVVARDYARSLGATPGIVAKIERPAALDDMDAIVRTADAVMVARGDMGVQLPLERVPLVQKEIIAACNRAGTPVITATQMLESMIMQPVPTRAEASDVANAVLDGADAVMLSAETATGRNPVAAVEMMGRIIREVERHGPIRSPAVSQILPATDPEQIITDALGRAAREMTDAAPIDCIVVFTLSGASARLVAKFRPGVLVIAITPDPYVARKLSLVWGVRAIVSPIIDEINALFASAGRQIVEAGYANAGDEALFVGSVPIYHVSGRTNLLHVRTLDD